MQTLATALMSPFSKAIGSAIISYTAHYGMSKAYNMACVPSGFYGFLQGMVTSGSPVCQAARQNVSATQISYSQLIMVSISTGIMNIVASRR